MPQHLEPGIAVEELGAGADVILGVATGTAAFLGVVERGPTEPRLVTSFNEYVSWFGSSGGLHSHMPYVVRGFFENGGQRLYVCRIVGRRAATASHAFGDLVVTAIGAGEWGNRVWVAIQDSTKRLPDPADPGATKPVGIRIRAAYWTQEPPDGELFDPFLEPERQPRPSWVEDFDDVVVDDAGSPDHFRLRVSGRSQLIGLSLQPLAQVQLEVLDGASRLAGGGNDGIDDLGVDDFIGDGAESGKLAGLAALALDAYGEVALVYAPNASDDVARAVVSHCERQRFCFAVVDGPPDQIESGSIDPRLAIADTSYAAFYHPWLYVADPETGARRKVPPGGHVLGVYARTDAEQGVFKAPANEPLNGVIEVEHAIDHRQQEILNPLGVNLIRTFPQRGVVVWGARTLSTDPQWKYVAVRRLFIFLKHSIQEGIKWAALEANDDRLWTRVRESVGRFLGDQHRSGAFAGRSEKEAFFVYCDRSTMTDDDILNGRLVCEIGIAPVRPAEFVILRFFHHTNGPPD